MVAKIVREYSIRAKQSKKSRCTTDSKHSMAVAENILERCFEPKKSNGASFADITYILTR